VQRIHLLKDLLKADFPEARILSFAHNSDWLINAPIKTGQQIGNKLMEQLRNHRSNRRVRNHEALETALLTFLLAPSDHLHWA
jgi:hypothetical protein